MKKIIGFIVVVVMVSCKNNSAEKKFDKLEKLNWLVGSWEQKLPEGTLVENWKMENDSTYSGESYFIKEKDTLSFESIELLQKGDMLYYIPTVKGQNNDKPVTFKMTSDADNSFTFENPAHDYPQKIVYKKAGANDLIATISGKQQGKDSQESYAMKKK
jgi:hypothetical protein